MAKKTAITKRATRKPASKPRVEGSGEVHMIRIPVGDLIKEVFEEMKQRRAKREAEEAARPALPDAAPAGANAVTASNLAESTQAEPSLQDRAALNDKWAYEVRSRLTELVTHFGGREALSINGKPASSTGEEIPAGLRGTLQSTTVSLSQSLDLLSTLRTLAG